MSLINKRPGIESRRAMLLTVAVGLVASACSQAPTSSNVQADKNVKNSFSTVSKAELSNRLSAGIGISHLGDLAYLEVKKDALDKEFLLSGSIISQRGAPTSSGLQGRVVAFSKKGKSIFLMEATDGHVVTDSLPSSLILAEIPVILETEKSFILDFNSGMQKVFTNGNWFASDMTTPEEIEKGPISTASIRSSYLQKIQIVDEENIEIRQIVQVEGGDTAPNFEVRYFLSPYMKNEAFKPRETGSFDRVGYFETPPVLEKVTGRNVIRTTHFDISKPVKFYVSANTPKEYQEAVADGILYWNKVFGKEVIQVEIAPENVTAPDPRFNIVQWVEWDQAGFAYADALMDPRTGETKHAQVYMTSAFAWGSNVRAARLLRQADESSSDPTQNAAFAKKIGLKDIPSSLLCINDATSRMAQVASVALQAGVSDETMLMLSRDYIREVVAHEIGHTLGLRHNFAGNFASNVGPEVMDQRVISLVKDAKTPVDDIITSSSVMEYQPFSESVITGKRIAEGAEAYSYDKLAIRHAYLGESFDPLKAPLFCTDSHAEAIADCVRFDRGRNPIEGGLFELRRIVSEFPAAFVEAHLGALAPTKGTVPKEIAAVNVDPEKKATEASAQLTGALGYLDLEKPSILLLRKYLYLNSVNNGQLVRDRYELVKEEAARQGGFDKMIFDVLTSKDNGLLRADWADLQVEGVKRFLSKKSVTQFIGMDGQKMELSDEQKAEILAKARPYFLTLQQSLLKKVLTVYSETTWNLELEAVGDLEQEGLTVALENGLGENMKEIVLRQGEALIVIPLAPDNKVLFRNFSFSRDNRVAASGLLAGTLVDIQNWSKGAREQTKAEYTAIITSALGIESIEKLDEVIEAGNRSLQLWWKKEAGIWGNIQ